MPTITVAQLCATGKPVLEVPLQQKQTWPFCMVVGGYHTPRAELSGFLVSVLLVPMITLPSLGKGSAWKILNVERIRNPRNLSGLLSSWSPECSAAWCLSGYGFQGHQLPGAQGSADSYIFTMLVMNKPHTSAGRGGKSSSSENSRVESEWWTLASQTGLW